MNTFNSTRILVDPASGTNVSLVRTLRELELISDEWLRLWRQASNTTPFQSPAWLIPWWRHLGQRQLWTLLVRKEGELIGLAPFFIYQRDLQSPRTVLLMGTGITDFLDIIATPQNREIVANEIMRYMMENLDQWDECDFHQLQPGSQIAGLAFPNTASTELLVQEYCPVLKLSNFDGDPSRSIPASMAEKLRYYRRRATKAGTFRVQFADSNNFDYFFSKFLELHASRWSLRGQPGVLADAAIQQFHWDAAKNLQRIGLLRLISIQLNDSIIASLYGFSNESCFYYYLSGFDPDFQHFSPGTLIIGQVIEYAMQSKCAEFHFLRGQEAYKYRWGAFDRPNFQMRVVPNHTLANTVPIIKNSVDPLIAREA